MIPAFIISLIMKLQETVGNFFLNKRLKTNPKDCAALLKIAEIPLRNGKYEEALRSYNKVLEIDPNNQVANFYTGLINLKLKKFEESVTRFKGYLANPINKPKNQTETEVFYLIGEAYYYLGFANYQLGRIDEAKTYKDIALSKDRNISKLKLY